MYKYYVPIAYYKDGSLVPEYTYFIVSRDEGLTAENIKSFVDGAKNLLESKRVTPLGFFEID